MTGSVVAFFTCTALAVAPAISAKAREIEGTVSEIDVEARVLHLADGSRFALPESIDFRPVEAGETVHLVYEPAG